MHGAADAVPDVIGQDAILTAPVRRVGLDVVLDRLAHFVQVPGAREPSNAVPQ